MSENMPGGVEVATSKKKTILAFMEMWRKHRLQAGESFRWEMLVFVTAEF